MIALGALVILCWDLDFVDEFLSKWVSTRVVIVAYLSVEFGVA